MASHLETLSRQWLLLQRIPWYPHKITARELADHLRAEGHDISKRSVERDLLALSGVFPLASDERSKPFGWSWQKDARQFSLPGMSPLQAMVLNLARTHLQPLLPAHLLDPLQPYFAQAEAALRQALGKRGVADWNKRVAFVQPSQPLLPPKVDEKVLAVVHEAVALRRQLELRYRSRSTGKTLSCNIHPLGIVYRGVLGYLVATVADYGDARIFSLHRITSARVLDAASRTPRGFDLQAYAHSGAFGFMDNGPIRMVLRMTEPAADHLHETPLSTDQSITQDSRHGWVRITATVRDNSQLHWWLRGFGKEVEVVEPATLRRQLAD
ncbi:MAG: WYL domain-containing protein [Xanthomonadaceae bacterium]|nr:WYL domain-containing protein [Xanthomonadaceae bacterium]